jgi:hypothetical protein
MNSTGSASNCPTFPSLPVYFTSLSVCLLDSTGNALPRPQRRQCQRLFPNQYLRGKGRGRSQLRDQRDTSTTLPTFRLSTMSGHSVNSDVV